MNCRADITLAVGVTYSVIAGWVHHAYLDSDGLTSIGVAVVCFLLFAASVALEEWGNR